MSIEEKKLLTDIIVSIASIDEHLERRRSFEEYKANKTKRRAVEREYYNPENCNGRYSSTATRSGTVTKRQITAYDNTYKERKNYNSN
jgi:hypothetical protein